MEKKKGLKIIAFILLLLLMSFVVVQLEWVIYGVRQGMGQYHLISNAQKVVDLLEKEEISDSIKSKLRLIENVKKYGLDSLGLADSDIYKSVYDQKGEPVMFVVTACQPFQLIPYEWEIPLAGTFPYRGYFDKEFAIREREKLKEMGLDASIRLVDGWSTLGIIENPLLSENLNRTEGDLVNLVLHEVSHETIYIRNETTLNENLATFIGDEGTMRYLQTVYGKDSKEMKAYLKSESDSQNFVKHMVRGAGLLDELYLTFNNAMSMEEKKEEKELLIGRIIDSMDTLQLTNFQKVKEMFNEFSPDNTYFMSFIRYQSKQNYFYDTLQQVYENNLPLYIQHLKSVYN